MTKFKQPTDQEWKRLYELAVQVKELAPWEFMEESEFFGVKNPETEEIGFISVMGLLGEHLSIGVYRGAEGLYGYWNISDPAMGLENNPLALFDVPQLQASFEDRELLEKQDRDVIKKLGLKFRGSQNYPQFRSIRAGFMPYFVTQDEARFLIYALEQTLEIAPRIRDDENLLPDPDEDLYLVRVSENGVWRDEIINIPPPEEFTVFVDAPKEIVAELKNFPQKKGLVLEIDFDFAPMPVREKNQRPFFPKILMITEARQGMVVAFELIRPEETLTETHETIPYHLVENLRKLGVRPEEIRVKNERLFEMLRGFTQQINVKLRLVDELPSIEMAQESMFGFFGGGGMF
jgi:hypothetical protein